MFNMLNQLWMMLTTMFMAGEKFATSVNNLAEWTSESSASFVDEARIKRYSARQELLKELGISQDEFNKLTSTVADSSVKPKVKAIAALPGVTGHTA